MSVVTARLGPVQMKATRQRWVRHASDVMIETAESFGGDQLGHWNVARINRLLDAFQAPTIWLPIPREVRVEMARVGAPDANRAQLYGIMGIRSMPPLSFVQMPGGDPEEIRQMMVDGHHRMLALASLPSDVPVRILPSSLADDVRIVEMSEAVVFPEPAFGALRHADLGTVERTAA